MIGAQAVVVRDAAAGSLLTGIPATAQTGARATDDPAAYLDPALFI